METIHELRTIEKPASVDDAYDGGQKILRDTTGLEGGTPGHVNTPNFTRVITGYGQTSFEWATLSVLDNHARGGENVAGYFQANTFSAGPTWATCSEVCDTAGACRQIIAHEVDVWTIGADNGRRFGAYVVLGDGPKYRGHAPSANTIGASVGYMLEAQPGTVWTRGLQMIGQYVVGVDLSSAQMQTAIRLKERQAIALDQFDGVRLLYEGGRVKIMHGLQEVFAVDVNTGDVFRRGAKL